MIKSIGAVLVGILLALGIGVLVVLGILAPFFTRFFGQALASTAVPTVLLIFVAAFAFYFGGMFASYMAPSRRKLHGTMVGVIAFAVSPLVNLFTSTFGANNDPFAGLRTLTGLLVSIVLLVAVIVASYVGARRGETIYAHNTKVLRQREIRRERELRRQQEQQEREQASAAEEQ